MSYKFEIIVRDWFEGLKLPFINYIHANFNISYDDIMDIYTDTWIDLRNIILEDKATDNKWRALIFKIGWRKAAKIASRKKSQIAIEAEIQGGNKRISMEKVELQMTKIQDDLNSFYEDSDLMEIIGSELSVIPEPCGTLLKLFFYEEMSTVKIAEAMNYKTSRSVITTKYRCLQKLRDRIIKVAERSGII